MFGHLKQIERQKGFMRPDYIEGLILFKMNGISAWLSNLEKTERHVATRGLFLRYLIYLECEQTLTKKKLV